MMHERNDRDRSTLCCSPNFLYMKLASHNTPSLFFFVSRFFVVNVPLYSLASPLLLLFLLGVFQVEATTPEQMASVVDAFAGDLKGAEQGTPGEGLHNLQVREGTCMQMYTLVWCAHYVMYEVTERGLPSFAPLLFIMPSF